MVGRIPIKDDHDIGAPERSTGNTILVVPIAYRQSSRQARNRKNVNDGSACARLSRFPEAWRFDFVPPPSPFYHFIGIYYVDDSSDIFRLLTQEVALTRPYC